MVAYMPVGCVVWVLAVCIMVKTLVSAQSSASPPHYRTVCYVEEWAAFRHGVAQFHPEDVDTSLCTHIVFAFAQLDPTTFHILPLDRHTDPQLYRRLTGLKTQRPDLKVLLSVGGWAMGSGQFSTLVSQEANMQTFASGAVGYLRDFGFDGLGVDWEYPADRGSPPEDKHRFTRLLQILQTKFDSERRQSGRSRLELSAAISPSPWRVEQSYELEEIAKYVDFLNLMSYDIHGSWEPTLGHHSALFSPVNGTDSIDSMVQWVLNSTVTPEKLNLGLSFYGRSFNLTDPTNTQIGAAITGNAPGGDLIGDPGIMMYTEVCKLLADHSDKITDAGRLPGSEAPYVVDGSRWTGYDDITSIREKVDYAITNGLGGVFIWAIDMDDHRDICGNGPYPLLNAIKDQQHQAIIGR